AHAGVAVFDGRTGALLRWLPLATVQRADRALRIAPELPRGVSLRVTLAESEGNARRSWFARADVVADRPGNLPDEKAVALAGALQRVTVRATCPDGYGQDLQLRRLGDADWRPPDALRAGADNGGAMTLALGPGRYELQPCTGGPWQPVVIAV